MLPLSSPSICCVAALMSASALLCAPAIDEFAEDIDSVMGFGTSSFSAPLSLPVGTWSSSFISMCSLLVCSLSALFSVFYETTDPESEPGFGIFFQPGSDPICDTSVSDPDPDPDP